IRTPDRFGPQTLRIGVETEHDLRPALGDPLRQPIAEASELIVPRTGRRGRTGDGHQTHGILHVCAVTGLPMASMDATVTASRSRPQHPASVTVLLDGLLQARPSREPRDARSRN